MSQEAARRWSALCYFCAALLTIFLLRVVLTNNFGLLGDSWEGQGTADKGGLSAAFQIDGDASETISPGVSVPLDLRFMNPHEEPLTVTHLNVTIRRLTTPGADASHPCSMSDFTLTQMPRSVTIVLPPASTTSLRDLKIPRADRPQVGMVSKAVNQDGCRGAQLKLGYSAFGSLDS
jgi:hypothetical protein